MTPDTDNIDTPANLTSEQQEAIAKIREAVANGDLEGARKAAEGVERPVLVQTFFPPPDEPYEAPEDVTLEPVAIVRCATSASSKNVIFVGSTPLPDGEPGQMALVRFELPRHRKTVREFFKAGGIKEVPSIDRHWNVDGGMPIMLHVEGQILGEDTIPEFDAGESDEDVSPPAKCLVIGNATTRIM